MNIQNLRIATWNINCGVFTENTTEKVTSELNGNSYVVNCIKKISPDVIALQEMSFLDDDASVHLSRKICDELEYKYRSDWPLSESHQIDGGKLGLSIISKYPIVETEKLLLPNYNLQVMGPNNEILISHDKGILIGKIKIDKNEMFFISGHLIPFEIFNQNPSNPMFKNLWEIINELLIKKLILPVICCMDFNVEELEAVLPNVFDKMKYRKLIHQSTRPNGYKHDNILASPHLRTTIVHVLPTRFDHHFCFADFKIKWHRGQVFILDRFRPSVKNEDLTPRFCLPMIASGMNFNWLRHCKKPTRANYHRGCTGSIVLSSMIFKNN